MSDIVLKPCPFCGGTTIDIVENNDNGITGNIGYYCQCVTCESKGAEGIIQAGAMMLWNSRHEG